MMNKPVAALIGSVFLTASSAIAAPILAPPFGLQWGEGTSHVIHWAQEQKLEISVKFPSKDQRLREVIINSKSGNLPAHLASSLEVYYLKDKLYEVRVQYDGKGKSTAAVERDLNQVRKDLAAQYGNFVPDAERDRTVDQFRYLSNSYRIQPIDGLSLIVMMTKVEDLLRRKSAAKFTVIYRNQNIYNQVLAGGR